MKKLLLLIPLLFLCSCGNVNTQSASDLKENTQSVAGSIYIDDSGNEIKINYDYYELGRTRDDGYVYDATIDYLDNASLILYKYNANEKSVVVKKWSFGNYDVIYERWNNEYLYDYGSFAIYRPSGLK